jgi:hypothetical protein
MTPLQYNLGEEGENWRKTALPTATESKRPQAIVIPKYYTVR